MQDRYAGDVGDFGKFALLRAVAFDRRVGLIWYLTSGANERKPDGRHLGYLSKPDRFRKLDSALFDQLKSFHEAFEKTPGLRSVSELERRNFLKEASYFSNPVPPTGDARAKWLAAIMDSEIADSELIFLDPDNGIKGADLTPKHVALEEIASLRGLKRPLVIYHHQTRVKGGAIEEAKVLRNKMQELGCVRIEIIRLRPYSSRFYVFADHDGVVSKRLEAFVGLWGASVHTY
jgi:hypothetical protein